MMLIFKNKWAVLFGNNPPGVMAVPIAAYVRPDVLIAWGQLIDAYPNVTSKYVLQSNVAEDVLKWALDVSTWQDAMGAMPAILDKIQAEQTALNEGAKRSLTISWLGGKTMAKPTLAYLLRREYDNFEIVELTSFDRNVYHGRRYPYGTRTYDSFHRGVFGVTNDKATVGLWYKAARETYDRETVKVESLRNQLREAEKDRVNAVNAAIEKIGGKIVLQK